MLRPLDKRQSTAAPLLDRKSWSESFKKTVPWAFLYQCSLGAFTLYPGVPKKAHEGSGGSILPAGLWISMLYTKVLLFHGAGSSPW